MNEIYRHEITNKKCPVGTDVSVTRIKEMCICPQPTMNEKERRTEYQCIARGCDGCNICETPEQQHLRNDFYANFTTSSKQHIADWFIARIHERDQRLKEKILSLPAATRSECETENVLCANDIINLIDNHDQPRPEE